MVGTKISRCLTLATVALACGGSPPAFGQSAVRAGVSAAVKGEIQIASLGASIGRIAKSGEDIYLGDRISSGKKAGMQVLLLDETVFTIGSQSALSIDEFVYDPKTGGGNVTAQVVKGAFRFVTGRIAKQRPRAMAVKLPVGSIGIRGTIAAGRVDGNSSLVVLLGPGSNTNTDERVGRILVSSAGETVEISRVGFATMIEGPNAAPIEPFLLPLEDLRALTRSLDQGSAPKQEGGKSAAATQRASSQRSGGGQKQDENTGKSATRQQNGQANRSDGAGQQTSGSSTGSGASRLSTASTGSLAGEGQVSANQNANNQLNTGDVRKEGDKLLNDATQDDPVNQLPAVSAGVASFDEIRRIKTGTHSFTIDTAFVQTRISGVETNLPGNMKVRLDFDFGARTVGGGNSQVILDTTQGGGNISHTADIPLDDYAKDTGLATKTFGEDQADPPRINGSSIEILNGNGVIAQTMRADIKYDDGSGNRGIGAGESAPRVE